MSYTAWTDAFDVTFPVAWWDAGGDVVTRDATGCVRIRTTDSGASYLLYVHVPAGDATVAPDATHTLGGVVGYRLQVNSAGDGSGTWTDYGTGGYTAGWLQGTAPIRLANSASILPAGGSPGAVRVQVLTPTPSGTPTGDVLAEVTKLASGPAVVTVGESVDPRITRLYVVYGIRWNKTPSFQIVQSQVETFMVADRGVMHARFLNRTGPPEPTGWTPAASQSVWEWLPPEVGAGTLGSRELTFTIDNDSFNNLGLVAARTNHRAIMASYSGSGSANRANVFYGGEYAVTAGSFGAAAVLDVPPVFAAPLVGVRLSSRVSIDGGGP